MPEDATRYFQERARDDVRDVLAHLRIERAHIIGLSMGGFAALHSGLAYPSLARSLIIASRGYGAGAGHSTRGSVLTMRGVQNQRPSLWKLRDAMQNISVPSLILAGDEDDPCLEPAIMMKRAIPTAGLAVIPRTGHTINLEEPGDFNRIAYDIVTAVDAGRWGPREPRATVQVARK